ASPSTRRGTRASAWILGRSPARSARPGGRRGDRGGRWPAVPVSGRAKLALKVADLDEAVSFCRSVGLRVDDRMVWNGSERADVELGPVRLTLLTRAIYE